MNPTITKFGYPDTRVAEYDHWVVLLRPQQATLGALVLACTEPAQAFSDISAAAAGELARAVGDIEATLKAAFDYDKINYLMLMMVDPEVHFHVLPRYAESPTFGDALFEDAGWPGPPRLDVHTEIDDNARAELLTALRERWPPRT